MTMGVADGRGSTAESPWESSGGERTPTYSVVICTHNRADFVGYTLRTVITEANAIGSAGEILLVDNASTDGTKGVFDRCDAEHRGQSRLCYLFEQTTNLSVARNRGIAAARGDILIFLDDDAVPEPGWLHQCLAAFAANPRTLAVGGRIDPLLDGPAPEWFRPPLTAVYTVLDLGGECIRPFPPPFHPLGANMAFRRSVFAEHGFSVARGRSGTSLTSGDDSEVCGRIRTRGGEMLYVPGMAVRHYIHSDRLSEQWVLRRYYEEGVTRASMRFGAAYQARTVAEMGVKAVYLLATGPFVRGIPHRVLWRCRMQKARGYFTALAKGAIESVRAQKRPMHGHSKDQASRRT